jgi:hypothetical protein
LVEYRIACLETSWYFVIYILTQEAYLVVHLSSPGRPPGKPTRSYTDPRQVGHPGSLGGIIQLYAFFSWYLDLLSWRYPSINATVVGKMVTPWQFARLASHVVYRQYISCESSLSTLHLQHNTAFYLLVVGPSFCLILLVTVLAHRHCLCVDFIPCYTTSLWHAWESLYKRCSVGIYI